MAGRKHTPEQIVKKLREAEKLRAEGMTIGQAAKQLGTTEQTLHRWKNQYGDLSKDQAKRLKELENENSRLKKMVADQALDIDALKELARGNF
ncbi:MAG: transposase [Solirubrobacterales bacterium]